MLVWFQTAGKRQVHSLTPTVRALEGIWIGERPSQLLGAPPLLSVTTGALPRYRPICRKRAAQVAESTLPAPPQSSSDFLMERLPETEPEVLLPSGMAGLTGYPATMLVRSSQYFQTHLLPSLTL